MQTRERVVALLREHYPYLVAAYGVKRIGIFGSYAPSYGPTHRPSST